MDGYMFVLSNAVIMARPHALPLQYWLQQLPEIFDPQCYTCHSVGCVRLTGA